MVSSAQETIQGALSQHRVREQRVPILGRTIVIGIITQLCRTSPRNPAKGCANSYSALTAIGTSDLSVMAAAQYVMWLLGRVWPCSLRATAFLRTRPRRGVQDDSTIMGSAPR
jgi:hypothetical protein